MTIVMIEDNGCDDEMPDVLMVEYLREPARSRRAEGRLRRVKQPGRRKRKYLEKEHYFLNSAKNSFVYSRKSLRKKLQIHETQFLEENTVYLNAISGGRDLEINLLCYGIIVNVFNPLSGAQ